MLGQLKRRYSTRALNDRKIANRFTLKSKPTSKIPSALEAQADLNNQEEAILSPTLINATVQCSDCNTRFSVPEEFSNIEDPLKFHCPRCNHIFTSTVQRINKIQTGDHYTLNIEAEEEKNSTEDNNILAFQNASTDQHYHEEMKEELESPLVTKELQGSSAINTLQKNSLIKNRLVNPFKSAKNRDQNHSSSEALESQSHNQIDLPFMFEIQTKKARRRSTENLRGLINNLNNRKLQKKINEPAPPPSRLSIETFSNNQETPQIRHKFLKQTLAPCLLFTAPIIIATLSLLVISLAAANFPELRSSVMQTLHPSAVKTPPSGLYLDDLKTNTVSLTTGEKVTLVSGRIANHTAKTIKEIKLEVLGFNASGQLMEKSKALASNALTQAKVNTLTPEVLKSIQSHPRNNALKPGEEKNFELGIFDTSKKELAFFNTRIYSTRYN